MSSPAEKPFSISLINVDNKGDQAYNPGDKIIGAIRINGQHLTAFNQFAVNLSLFGLAYVKWDTYGLTETKNDFLRLEKKLFYLMPSYPGELIFEFDLPFDALPSFELPYGFVSYSIQANFIAYSPDPHIHCIHFFDVVAFTVNQSIDLNLYPALRAPGHVNGERTFCCGPCRSSPLKVEFTIARRGYQAGDRILCDVVVKNYTTKDVVSMNINLVFSSKFVMRRYGFELANKTQFEVKDTSKFNGTVRSLTNVKWSNVSLTIPKDISPGNVSTQLIKTSYYVELIIQIKGKRTIRKKISILIGTAPFKMTNNGLNSKPQFQQPVKESNKKHSSAMPDVSSSNSAQKSSSSSGQGSEQFFDSNEEFDIVPTSQSQV